MNAILIEISLAWDTSKPIIITFDTYTRLVPAMVFTSHMLWAAYVNTEHASAGRFGSVPTNRAQYVFTQH